MSDADRTAGGFRRTRFIRLVPQGAGMLVVPLGDSPSATAFPSRLPLPHVPISFAHWLHAIGELFRRDRFACLTVALLLDVRTGRWVPVLPDQHCGRVQSRWSPDDADFLSESPDLLLAGSFQTLGPGDPFEAAASVPPFDGLHFVEQRRPTTGRSRTSLAFLRFRDETHFADPAAVLVDDLSDTLRRYVHRLKVD